MDGGPSLPDYPAALKVWRRLLDLYDKEETRHHASATRSVEEILKVRADLAGGSRVQA